jgi:thiol-disulfide isomerase/thioredoxin
MDRLPLIVALIATCWSCKGDGTDKPPPASSRVNSVKAPAPKSVDLDAFCDVRPQGNARFKFPALSDTPPSINGKWQWINVWATWCKPCVEEIPLLVLWQEELRSFELLFVSADDDDTAIASFRKAHPNTPRSLRIASPDQLEAWFASIGLDRGATLPVHVFVDPHGSIRCIRTGAIASHDRAAVSTLVTSK